MDIFNQPIIDKSYEIYLNYIIMGIMFIGIVMIVSLLVDDVCKIYNMWKTRIMVAIILYSLMMFIKIGGMLQ